MARPRAAGKFREASIRRRNATLNRQAALVVPLVLATLTGFVLAHAAPYRDRAVPGTIAAVMIDEMEG